MVHFTICFWFVVELANVSAVSHPKLVCFGPTEVNFGEMLEQHTATQSTAGAAYWYICFNLL